MDDAELSAAIIRLFDEKARESAERRAGLRQPDPDAKRISLEAIYRAHPGLRPDDLKT